jgi:hypothetical protein
MKAIWTVDAQGKLSAKWVTPEIKVCILSDDELRSRINAFTNELLQRQLEDC